MVCRLLAALLAASLLLPLAYSDSTSSPPATTVYDELCLWGFLRGLLPANARAYTLNAGFGDFADDLHSSYRIILPAGSYLAASATASRAASMTVASRTSTASALGPSFTSGPS
jgi:hypothetical protein